MRKIFLWLFLLLAVDASAGLREDPVASLPTAPPEGTTRLVIDGIDEADCTVGGGNKTVLCTYRGAAWVAGGGGGTEADTLATVTTRGNTSTGNDENNPFEILGADSQSSYGISIDRTSGGESRWRCKEAAGLNKCNYYRQLDDTFKGGFKNSAGTVIWEVDEDTGKVLYETSDAEDANVLNTRPFYWDLDLCAINPLDGSLSHVWNKDPLSTAPTLTAKAGTNRSICVLTFPDSDGDYGVAIRRQLPDGWVGNLDADIWWDTTGTGNARFQIATKCYADDEADDASNNTASVVTAAAGTSGRPNKQTITGITTTGCAAGELLYIRFFRNRTEGSDSLNAALNAEKIRFKGRSTQ